jgi:imidazolonepropionase-like amidohydrolase
VDVLSIQSIDSARVFSQPLGLLPVDGSVSNQGHVSPFSLMSVIADGVDDVRRPAREELRKKATQIKVFASGGVVFRSEAHSTMYEYSEPELQAAVE